jgi:hypothetical protein
MKSARLRLAVAAALFLAWIGWLAYLAATTTHPEVLSRPQFLEADLVVIADVGKEDGHPNPEVRVVSVPWAKEPLGRKPARITVKNLAEFDRENGWHGPGRYILPLQKVPARRSARDKTAGEYVIARVPDSPGFPSVRGSNVRYRIYPDNAETRAQLENMRQDEWEK